MRVLPWLAVLQVGVNALPQLGLSKYLPVARACALILTAHCDRGRFRCDEDRDCQRWRKMRFLS